MTCFDPVRFMMTVFDPVRFIMTVFDPVNLDPDTVNIGRSGVDPVKNVFYKNVLFFPQAVMFLNSREIKINHC